MHRCRNALLLLLCLLAVPARATLLLTENQSALPLLGQIESLSDPEGRLQLAQLIAAPQRFQSTAGRRDLGFGYVDGAIWLRLEVQSTAPRPTDWRLELDYPSLDLVQLFDVGSDGLRLARSGDMVA